MNKHVSTLVPYRLPIQAMSREDIVDRMATHLVAAILNGDLDTSSDIDVIQCILDAPERFQSRVVLDHLDDALAEAKQILIAKEMGDDKWTKT